jgi:hypothetical protein
VVPASAHFPEDHLPDNHLVAQNHACCYIPAFLCLELLDPGFWMREKASNGDANHEPMGSRNQRWTRWFQVIFALTSVSIVLAFAMYWCVGPVIPRYRLKQVKEGMTQDQVRAIIGEPDSVYGGGWQYRKWPNPGWVDVLFDTEGRVTVVGDESVFPE